MHRIHFKYQDANRGAVDSKFIAKRHKWYLITFHDGIDFVISPANTLPTEWVQEVIPGEPVHSREFIRAVGSAVEAAGIV